MQATLIENNGTGRIAYDSLVVNDPKALSSLNSKLAMKIVKTLAEKPQSAIDISRKLKMHEQKIYYHMRRLERAGIIYTISNEKRHGMVAKIYSIVSPVIAAKLHEKGTEIKDGEHTEVPTNVLEFFKPFIQAGRFNAKIIIGDPTPHGTYNVGGLDGVHVIDLLLFLGRFISNFDSPNYKLDTEVRENDLKNNMILIGNNKTNSIIDKINSKSYVYFDTQKSSIISKITGDTYKDDRCGIVLKFDNPFDKTKKVMIIGGMRTRGTRAAMIAILKILSNNLLNIKNNENFHYIVQGMDKDSDMIIDDAVILEGN
ncbi:MAG: helix-turn-helix transcriptional regulator [Candidatus Aenigmarchaeota archaeon]|nr:helix-turn-helix transcriptional regulator [Candidatus Aenigmarchaeota archaeon]